MGVQAVHRSSMVHCDIKPHNIMVEQDEMSGKLNCALGDFGSVQITTEDILQVKAFKILQINAMSVAYAAPEILRDKQSAYRRHPSTDVYSIGVVMFNCIAGMKR